MSKSPDAFRSIGEVSRLVGVAPHVLRYWESQFAQLSPVKRADGRRYYRPDDVRLAAGLCQVLREEGLSIRGAKRLISADRGAGLREIGAARLGETMGADPQGDPAPRQPAVQLAVPGARARQPAAGTDAGSQAAPKAAPPPAPAADAAPPAHSDPARSDTDRTAAVPRRRRAADSTALPLFPDLDRVPPGEWLGRLAATAAALRSAELRRNPLPATANELRDALRNAR